MCSPRIRHRNELTERDWENAVQGLGKGIPWLGLVSLCQIWDFYGYSLNTLKYPKMGIRYFFLCLFLLTNHWCCWKSGRVCLSTRTFPLESKGKAVGTRLPQPHRKWSSLTTLWWLFPPEPKCPIYISTEHTCYAKLKGWLSAPDLDAYTGGAQDNIRSLTWKSFVPSAGQGKRGPWRFWCFGAISGHFSFLVVEELTRRRPILESFNCIFRLLVTF